MSETGSKGASDRAASVTDALLIQIVDAALVDVAKRSGAHLVCRPGCAQCCVGAFRINALDADRLRRGYAALAIDDPVRFTKLKARVRESVARTVADYPGDANTGALDESAEGQARFEDFANDEVCPVLDPAANSCDLYAYRPMTCRVFGPPVRSAGEAADEFTDRSVDGLGVCELCFTGATEEEVAACELIADPDDLEGALLKQAAAAGTKLQTTTVAQALFAHDAQGRR